MDDGTSSTKCKGSNIAPSCSSPKRIRIDNENSCITVKPAKIIVKDLGIGTKKSFENVALGDKSGPPAPVRSKIIIKDLGNGEKGIEFDFLMSHFGPIILGPNEDLSNFETFLKFKMEERIYKDNNGGRSTYGFYETTKVFAAKSALPTQVIDFVNNCFTKKNMEKHRIGKDPSKKRNYPKRSETIRIDSNQPEDLNATVEKEEDSVQTCLTEAKPALKIFVSEEPPVESKSTKKSIGKKDMSWVQEALNDGDKSKIEVYVAKNTSIDVQDSPKKDAPNTSEEPHKEDNGRIEPSKKPFRLKVRPLNMPMFDDYDSLDSSESDGSDDEIADSSDY